MEGLTRIVSIKKSNNKCSTHNVKLIQCPSKDCTGCHFSEVCNEKEFCGSCAEDLKQRGLGTNQKVYKEEYLPIVKELNALRKVYENLKKSISESTDASQMQLTESKARCGRLKESLKIIDEKKKEIKGRMY